MPRAASPEAYWATLRYAYARAAIGGAERSLITSSRAIAFQRTVVPDSGAFGAVGPSEHPLATIPASETATNPRALNARRWRRARGAWRHDVTLILIKPVELTVVVPTAAST
jgi:hypothetical protein